ncbi:MAG TPA: Dabb family protein [Streptosporangiaceae bacterium]|nr:Dabb family protein [Streptosporangiaceae bacterium]
MIRNVVVGRLRPAGDPVQRAADAALLQEGLAGIAALRFPGLLAMNVGCDLGLRDGGWSFAITNDWQDAAAYRVYDADGEHNRLRQEIFAKICDDIARVQFEVKAESK